MGSLTGESQPAKLSVMEQKAVELVAIEAFLSTHELIKEDESVLVAVMRLVRNRS